MSVQGGGRRWQSKEDDALSWKRHLRALPVDDADRDGRYRIPARAPEPPENPDPLAGGLQPSGAFDGDRVKEVRTLNVSGKRINRQYGAYATPPPTSTVGASFPAKTLAASPGPSVGWQWRHRRIGLPAPGALRRVVAHPGRMHAANSGAGIVEWRAALTYDRPVICQPSADRAAVARQ